ncbi:hypothetical protein [Litorivivens sp.]|uniref:hypothetical protein n=1 Tax=Litorivivens sp. TaxID=2020868 RepID=UPI0035648C01
MVEEFRTRLAKFQVIPNLMMVALGYQAFTMGEWFMALPAPSANQSAFVTAFYTLALPAAMKFYLQGTGHATPKS